MLLEQNTSKVRQRRLDESSEWITVSCVICDSEHGDDILLRMF